MRWIGAGPSFLNASRCCWVPYPLCRAKPYAQEQLFSCATNSAKDITDLAKEKGFNRVVIGACSPRTLEPLFQDTLRPSRRRSWRENG